MNFTDEELQGCLDKANEFAEHYKLNELASDDPIRATDALLDICKKYIQKNIRYLELEIKKEESVVWGVYFKTADGFDVGLVQGLNYCWRRFVLCKELFHIILDKEEYRNMDIDGHVTEVTVAFPDADSKPSEPVRVEFMAEIAAMEFLFPFAERVKELNGPNKGNFLAIAETYKVPQVFVERYMSDAYMGTLGRFSRQ